MFELLFQLKNVILLIRLVGFQGQDIFKIFHHFHSQDILKIFYHFQGQDDFENDIKYFKKILFMR